MKPDVYKQLFEVMKNRRDPYTGIEIPEFYTLDTEELIASLKASFAKQA